MKDLTKEPEGALQLTRPTQLKTDVSVLFWSMPENIDHPTHKPHKLIAKLVLASSRLSVVALDPFLGSGTTSIVANKRDMKYIGIEQDETYCLLAKNCLELADCEPAIRGFSGGYFWQRNSLSCQKPAVY